MILARVLAEYKHPRKIIVMPIINVRSLEFRPFIEKTRKCGSRK